MKTSTILMKNNRIRICDKTKLANLVNHILRNYKPETIQYKRDFHADETKNNILIGSDFRLKVNGENWFDNVEAITKEFKDNLSQSLIDADEDAEINISLSRSEKDKTIKSIKYFSNIKNVDPEIENSLLSIITTCESWKNQNPKEKDYSIFDKDELNEAIDFYQNPTSGPKIKSLKAKLKNLNQIKENVEAMKVANDRKATASTRAIGFEETLIKIPKHNNVSIEYKDMLKIYRDWHKEHFSNFKILGGALHKDERTKKDNAVDDHLHVIKSGFNQETKKFDLPDFTFKKGLALAKKQGLDFNYDGENYNKASEELRLLAGEALQTEFYDFANKQLEKYDYDFTFEKKELNADEKKLRELIKSQAHLPKAKRDHNMATYYAEQAIKSNQEVIENNLKIEEEQKIDYKDLLEYNNNFMGYLSMIADNNPDDRISKYDNKEFHRYLKTTQVIEKANSVVRTFRVDNIQEKEFHVIIKNEDIIIRNKSYFNDWKDELPYSPEKKERTEKEFKEYVLNEEKTKTPSRMKSMKDWLSQKFSDIYSKIFNEEDFKKEEKKHNDLIHKVAEKREVKTSGDTEIKAVYKSKYKLR